MSDFNLETEVRVALDSLAGPLAPWCMEEPHRVVRHVTGFVMSSMRHHNIVADREAIFIETLRQVVARVVLDEQSWRKLPDGDGT